MYMCNNIYMCNSVCSSSVKGIVYIPVLSDEAVSTREPCGLKVTFDISPSCPVSTA